MNKVWLIDPHDPLIFRDGKPFSAIPGATAQTLAFPLPSSTAGGLRHLAGLDQQGSFIVGDPQAKSEISLNNLKAIEVKGPFLAQLSAEGTTFQWLMPAPGDALLFTKETNEQVAETTDEYCQITQLVPLTFPANTQTDLPVALKLVGQKRQNKERQKAKPLNKAPRFWYWRQFERWLVHPEHYEQLSMKTSELGIIGPLNEVRIHVAINPSTRTGLDQALFATVGLRFNHVPPAKSSLSPKKLSKAERLALAIIVNENQHTQQLPEQKRLSVLGGERRIVSWRASHTEMPDCPREIITKIKERKTCRLILLTPAIFAKDSQPNRWLIKDHEEVSITIDAIKVDHHQTVSGWDLEQRQPKPTRRMVPAGSVFFLSLKGSSEAIEAWIKRTWFTCISDTEQDCRDGFGVVVLGVHTSDREEDNK